MAAPLRMQPPQTEMGHPVQKNSAKGIPEGPVSIGLASCTSGDHSERMP